MARAERGEELTIGFFGGSITQGSLASDRTKTYAYRVYTWWCENFPRAVFHYVNGGIGGTDSHFGAARAEEDLLMYQPDVAVIDFSVNDKGNGFFQETYEGLIRKILGWQSRPALLILNNVDYDTGINAQEYHNSVGDYYGIPHVSVKESIYRRMKNGVYAREELTSDGLHPNDRGHRLVAEEIIRLLENAKKELQDPVPEEPDKELPKAMTVNAYETARRLNIRNTQPKLAGFRADTEEKKGHLDAFKNGWIGRKKGDRIIFVETCSCIAVQYRKTIQKPAPVARAVLDGNEEDALILDGNYEETWGDCLYLEPLLHHGERKKHKIEIEIMEAGEKDVSPFYLLSLIMA